HLTDGSEQPRVMPCDLDRFKQAILARQLADPSAHKPENQPGEPAGLSRLNPVHVSHIAILRLPFHCGPGFSNNRFARSGSSTRIGRNSHAMVAARVSV